MHPWSRWLRWHLLQLPSLFLLMMAGFLLEWVVALPFALACRWDRAADGAGRARRNVPHRQKDSDSVSEATPTR